MAVVISVVLVMMMVVIIIAVGVGRGGYDTGDDGRVLLTITDRESIN
jgi:hypothetical protein